MKKISLLLIIIFPCLTFAQKYEVKLRVHYVELKSDTLKYEQPKEFMIPIEVTTSKIVTIGKKNDKVFGFQIEIFDSKLNEQSRKLACLAFYKRDEEFNKWVEICHTEYLPIELIEGSTPMDYSRDQSSSGYGAGMPTNFYIAYDIEYRQKSSR